MNWLSPIINFVAEYGSLALEFITSAAASAAVLAAVVLFINVCFRRWLNATQTSLLWGLVLLRLALPWAPSSSLSLQNLLVEPSAAQPHTFEEWMSQPRSPDESLSATLQPSLAASNSTEPSWAELTGLTLILDWPLGTFMFAWPCGMIFILTSTFALNWRFSRRVGRAPICSDVRLTNLWRASCQLAGVRKTIPIVLFDDVRQPAVMGALYPKLLLPTEVAELDDRQLRMIMLHELAHVRRWDVAINWVLVLIRSVHWWNPVYWLASARFCCLREQACDAFVIRRLNGEPARSYGELLLNLAQRSPGPRRWRMMVPASILTFISSAFRRRSVGLRLKALRRAGLARSRWHLSIAALLIGLLAYCGLTDAKTNSTSSELPPASNLPINLVEAEGPTAPPPASDEPTITREYDIGNALVDHQSRTLPAAHRELKAILAFCWSKYELQGNRLTVTATDAEHNQLAKCLRAWAAGDLQITLECRFLTLSEHLKSSDKIAWQYQSPFAEDKEKTLLPADSAALRPATTSARMEEELPVIHAVLDPQTAQAVLKEAQQSTRTNIRQAPKVTCFSGQLAVIADVSQRPFVVGVRQSAPGVQEPKIAIAEEGTRVALQPVLSADGSRVQLKARFEMCGIGDVATVNIKSPPATEPATVQMPHVKRCVIDVTTAIPTGHSLLIGPLRYGTHPQANLYVLLTPTEVH